MEEPYYRPGEGEGKPRQALTEFSPNKPAGLDPVTPLPLAEGSEIERHAQLFAFDVVSGNFKPVLWTDGSVQVAVDPFAPVIDTLIQRDPNTGLVSLIAETDGVRTKNSVFTRDTQGRVTNIHEVLV